MLQCFGDGCVSLMNSLQVQKSPAHISGKTREIHTTFQGAFCIRECGSSILPRSARQSDNWRLLSLKSYKCPPIAAFCRFTLRLQAPNSAQSQSEIADSLWQIFEIFPFLGDDGRRPGSIYTAWRRCAPAEPPDYESVGQSQAAIPKQGATEILWRNGYGFSCEFHARA